MVINPEKMVISEARRAFTYLNLFGFNTDAVIVNRVLPAEAGTGYWSAWREIHAKYVEEIPLVSARCRYLNVPMMELEVHGLPMLERIGEAAFAGCDPQQCCTGGEFRRFARRVTNTY